MNDTTTRLFKAILHNPDKTIGNPRRIIMTIGWFDFRENGWFDESRAFINAWTPEITFLGKLKF